MKSPFPGMDPYLEQHWGDVHTSIATYAKDAINLLLPPNLVARIEEHIAVEDEEADDDETDYYSPLRPDVGIAELPAAADDVHSVAVATGQADTVQVLRRVEPLTQRSIRIIDTASRNRVVTAIEFLSPANKIGTAGRKGYDKKRKLLLRGRVSLVEIDLIRKGSPNLAVAISRVPVRFRGPYRICVVRGWRSETAELYHVGLRTPLPSVAIPLRKSDPEVSLELQMTVDKAYENGRYGGPLFYMDAPDPPLGRDDADWADALILKKKRR